MTTKELLNNIKISYYTNVKYSTSDKTIRLVDWFTKYPLKFKNIIDSIRNEYDINKEKAKKMKSMNLPAVTMSAIFDGTQRRVGLELYKNPIICVDIDKDDNTNITDWNELKKKIYNMPSVFLVSKSCSGKGLFALIYISTEKPLNNIFNAISEDFENIGVKIDQHCKDITRLRFLSYDDWMLIKPMDYEVPIYDREKIIELNHSFQPTKSDFNWDEDFTYKAIYYLIEELNYRANEYGDWILDGFRLATLGYKGYLLFMMLSIKSSNYDRDAAESQFATCLAKTRFDKTSLTHYFHVLKEKLGKNWIEIIKNTDRYTQI